MKTKAQEHREPILSARGIVNRFGSQEVHDNISLDILPGEILGIAGGSGSGKSVLLRTLTGLHRPDKGKVLIGGKPVESKSNSKVRHRRRSGPKRAIATALDLNLDFSI